MQGRNGVILSKESEDALEAWREETLKPGVVARHRRLLRTLARWLSNRQRRIILLLSAGVSQEEIANKMELSLEQVDVIYNQAVDELKRYAAEFGEYLEEERANNRRMKSFLHSIH